MSRHFRFFFAGLAILATVSAASASEFELPPLFTDHMVLQRDMPVTIWGTATPNNEFTITFRQQTVQVQTDESGQWKATLAPEMAGGPDEMRLIGTDTLVIRDVLVGEVWLASGQSNMEMPLAGWGQVMDYEAEIANANHPEIRLFQVEKTIATTPQSTIPCDGWEVCSPATIPEFSSTAYFFGRKLQEELDIPVGLIHSSWGGTIVETWMSAAPFDTLPGCEESIKRFHILKSELDSLSSKYPDQSALDILVARWRDKLDAADMGSGVEGMSWADPDLDDSDWETIYVPSIWENQGHDGFDGIAWMRKSVNLPQEWQTGTTTLLLSAVDDVDSTYFNGILIGSDNVWDAPRKYRIPAELIRSGSNTISVRVLDTGGGGGIWGEPELMKLIHSEGEELSLAGDWQFKIGMDLNSRDDLRRDPRNPNLPTLCSNGMIEPLIPYGIRGAIWYQGEANVAQANLYRTLFPAMIKNWRQRWGQGDFPFLYVQLASFMERNEQPVESDWAELREAQLMTLSVPNTGMTVTIDIGDAEDIHPKNKQEVGRRLALNALDTVYGYHIPSSGPLYRSFKVKGKRVVIEFDHCDGGLVARDGELSGFAVAGEDRVFHWAKARIKGDRVTVSSPKVRHPVAVRYAWAANPECNLFNGSGLPASPFRTDDWPGITE